MIHSTMRFRIFTAFYKNYFKHQNWKKVITNNYKILSLSRSKPIGIPVILGLSWPFASSETKEIPKEESVKNKNIEKLKDADQLFDNGQFEECSESLKSLNSQDVEVLWRIARALYQMANKPNIDGKLKTKLAYEAFETITLAMKINENHFAVHKWMSVILDLKSGCDGTKERVKNLEIVKQHMIRAIEINPGDATTLYMLGEWCYGIADMPWYQRKIAKTLFAEPPTSTYEEALSYFLKAEVVEPNFYSKNLLMIGKSYLKMEKVDAAKFYLTLALMYPARTNDDNQANKEAQDILKTMK